MIGFLRGRLVARRPPLLLIEVQGVGYEVEAPLSAFYTLPGVGEEVTLYTHLAQREDSQALYGFAREAERALFRQLIRVNGVGPRTALAILSGMSAEDFARCLACEDLKSLVAVPGIGRKTAQRLVIELKDRLTGQLTDASVHGALGLPVGTPADEAISALVGLGYSSAEATRMVDSVAGEGGATEEILRRALKEAVRVRG